MSECPSFFHKERTMITRRHFAFTLAALPFAAAKVDVRAVPVISQPSRFASSCRFRQGGSTDVGARLIAENLSRAFGQQVYVENKSAPTAPSVSMTPPRVRSDGYTHSCYDRHGCQQSTRIPYQHRSLEGFVADHPGFTSAHRAGGSSVAARQLARRIDCAGKEAAGPVIRDRKRTGIAATYGGAMVLRRSPASRLSKCRIAAAVRRSTICSAAM